MGNKILDKATADASKNLGMTKEDWEWCFASLFVRSTGSKDAVDEGKAHMDRLLALGNDEENEKLVSMAPKICHLKLRSRELEQIEIGRAGVVVEIDEHKFGKRKCKMISKSEREEGPMKA